VNAPAQLRNIVRELGAFADVMVFTGGLVLPLYLTRRPILRIRPTLDADAVVACASHRDWIGLQGELGRVGVVPLAGEPSAPICRMKTASGHLLDLMPTEPAVLGFANRWFKEGYQRAILADLGDALTIQIFPAPLYFAAKVEAFRGRGLDDPWTSHDLEDILTLIACRPALPTEIQVAEPELRAYLSAAAKEILGLNRLAEIILANVGEREERIVSVLTSFASDI
jgi:hypothetical protein